MGGFNDLLEWFKGGGRAGIELVEDFRQHRGWGRVNQWHETDAKELAKALAGSGCNATLCELLSFAELKRWQNMGLVFDQSRAFQDTMRDYGINVHWTLINWNQGEGIGENGSVSICNGLFSDAWFANILAHCSSLAQDGGCSFLPCSELGVRNAGCRSKGLAWHKSALRTLGAGRTRWNGNGDATPSGVPNGEILEWHLGHWNDQGYPRGSLVVTDTSSVLNELGGLRNYATNHDRLRIVAQNAKARGCGFVHYGFSTPGIDYEAIKVVGSV